MFYTHRQRDRSVLYQPRDQSSCFTALFTTVQLSAAVMQRQAEKPVCSIHRGRETGLFYTHRQRDRSVLYQPRDQSSCSTALFTTLQLSAAVMQRQVKKPICSRSPRDNQVLPCFSPLLSSMDSREIGLFYTDGCLFHNSLHDCCHSRDVCRVSILQSPPSPPPPK